MKKKLNYNFPDNYSIYFGHQSVGENIIEGIKETFNKNGITFPVSTLPQQNITIEKPGFYHSKLGQNHDALSKIKAFKETLESDIGNKINLAFLKLCYVDIKHQTDVREIFLSYKSTFEKLEKEFPEIVFLHFTVPLRINQKGIKVLMKKILNFPVINSLENIKRYEFNELMRKEYSEKQALFDIAFYESSSRSGKHNIYQYKGKKYEALQEAYTYDGGHLNQFGSEFIANKLLTFIKDQLNG